MKKLYSLVLLIGVMMAFCVPAGAVETLTLSNELFGTSYNTSTQTLSASTSSESTVSVSYLNVANMSSLIQIKVNTANCFYSTTVPNNTIITGVSVNVKTNTANLYLSKDGKTWTSAIELSNGKNSKTYTQSDGYKYFKIGATSEKYTQLSSVVITYGTAATMYSVTLESATGGTIKADKSSAAEGDKVTLSYTENEGYYFDSWTVLNEETTEFVVVSENSFTMPAAAVTVEGTFTACEALSAPNNVQASSVTTTGATLTWNAVENASSYSIGLSDGKTYTTTTNSYTFTGLTAGTEYIALITAVGDGHRYCSSSSTGDVDFTTVALTQLATPTNLTIANPKYSSATLTWDAVANATKYEVTIRDADSKTTTYETTATTYEFTGLAGSAYYIVFVKAIGDGTNYSDSEDAIKDFTTVAQKQYTLTFSDQGGSYKTEMVYEDATVSQPDAPTGVCTEPIEYIFDGWAEAAVSEGATTYTKVTFPYTMPAEDKTLYAVYRYSLDGYITPTKINADSLVDGKKYYITASYNGTEYILKAGAFEAKQSGNCTATFKEATVTVDMAWQFVKSGDNWMIKSGENVLATEDDNNKLYSNSKNAQTWSCKTTTDKYVNITNITYQKRKLSLYQGTNWRTYTSNTGVQSIQLYTAGSVVYTSSPVCRARITGTKGIRVTAANGIWVEAADTLEVSATNLNKNEDGAAVSISAEVVNGNFTLKTAGTAGSGSQKLNLVTGSTDASYSQKLVVVYTPTADNTNETGQILLKVYKTNGTTEFATATVDVQGHSLPAEFVIAANTTNGWVALPSDLGIGSTSTVKAPYSIEVDDTTNPTKATQAPATALYKGAARSAANTCANAMRLMSVSNNAYLQASTAASGTGIWLSTNNSDEAQPWKLTSSDFVDYTVRVEKAETGRYLGYDASQGKIANYKTAATLRFLPVEATCTRFEAPTITSVVPASDKVTLVWAEIAGAADYEYSTDSATWSSDDLSATTGDGTTTAILSGLTASTDYTIYVRVRVSGENCSPAAKVNFTTTDCDDVPTGLTATATATSVTVSWKCQAATATVGIYADAACASLVVEKTGAKSPCMISGLTPNTKYYYRVLADGSCASATETFSTEATNVNVVEWKKDAVVVELNTDGDDVRVIIEGQTSHGDKTKNVADDLFFSKYYEATGNVKLFAIYNGTTSKIDLSPYTVKIGRVNDQDKASWALTIQLSQYGKETGYIDSGEEIIVYSAGTQYPTCNSSTKADCDIMECVKTNNNFDFSTAYLNKLVSFSGHQQLVLCKNTAPIDILGSITENTSNGLPVEVTEKPTWGDNNGWVGYGESVENSSEKIAISMNRSLLIRKNTVKSGANTLTQNINSRFNTLGTYDSSDPSACIEGEWNGKQIPETDADDGVQASCDGFAYVAEFNYNNYYTSYDSITSMDIQGKQNPDGSYTIPIDRLDTMACTNMRIEVKQNGVVVATKDQRVPIVVTVDSETDDTLFTNDRLSEEICKTCDVVVRDKAKLSHTSTGVKQFRNMYVYAGAKLEIPATETFTLATAHVHGLNDSVAYAIINNGGTITIDKLVHVKRIDGKYWYPFALPYDCNIADICQLSGLSLGTYGVDWGIKYYDGEKRQKDGNSMTTFGEVSKYWTMMAADGTLKAHTGYIIGLFYDNENLMRSIYFTPAAASNYVENGDTKTTQVTNWPHNLTADARHHGWNFVGSPYISLFGSGSGNEGTDGATDGATDGVTDGATDGATDGVTGEGILNSSLKMGYTQRDGTQADKEHVYVSIPDGGNTNTYTQALASATTLKPFSAYFVQAIDPTDGTSHQLDLTYSKNNRSLPSRVAMAETAADEPILVEMTLTGADTTKTNATMTDNAGVWMSNRYSTDYEIGDDLYKMYAESTKPQLYTTDAAGLRMAYLAVPDQATIPVGLYVPAAGAYTLSLNEAVSRLGAAQAVYLQHNGTVVADLMSDAYTLSATQRGTVSGYALAIHRAPHTTTAIDNAEAPHAVFVDGQIVVSHLPADATVRVYDVLGHLCYNATATESAVEVPATVRGVYTIVVATESAQTVLKTLAY